LLKTLFIQILHEHPSEISNEFERYLFDPYQVIKSKEEEKELGVFAAKPPSHSLELNLMLVFLYMASTPYGILEKDVLQSA
jgi:hypothetical protein